ncbi:MAG: hypothetical protein D3915_00215 [Candidatus Electrothrix sp. AU1_5]|nr:hypothetical protein [Candidatus Electrothrix gigas]
MNRKTGKRKKISHANDHNLLLRCLCDAPDASELEQLTESNWHDLIKQARSHAVLYLLYHRLKTRNLDHLIPTDTLKAVRTEYFECAWRNNRLYDDLLKILKALHRENIPVIVLKGAHLAQIVYGNIALRPMGDIDILVKKEDLLQAKEHLLGLGYTPFKETDIATACANSQHLPPMLKQDAPPVELHWTIENPTRPFTIDIEGLWQRAQPASVGGVDTLTLSPEDLLLHLCLHTAAHHLYSNGLRALCDIRESIRHYREELDWKTVQLRAEEWGVSNAIYLTLYLAKSLLGAEVPDTLLNKLEPEQGTPMLAEAEQFLFNSSVDRRLSANHQARKLFASNALQTARLFLQRIFLPHETIAQLYNLPVDSPRILLYYPVRLKDLLVRHTRTVWRIWRRDKATVRQFELVDWLSH